MDVGSNNDVITCGGEKRFGPFDTDKKLLEVKNRGK
jgi:hypothetical protein